MMMNMSVLVSVVFFLLLFAGRTLMLMRNGVKVFVFDKGENKTFAEKYLVIFAIPMIALFVLKVVFSSLNIKLFLVSPFFNNKYIALFGIILCFVSIIIFLFALIDFGSAWRIGVDKQNSHRLVTRGIFSCSRNPVFVSMGAYVTGIFLIFPNWIFLAFLILAYIGLHLQVLNEEKFLKEKFGSEYKNYCLAVRRYF
ncbi:MAG: isoprenylcysteine carboxylmethyltransferase family protein [Endomicrobia bacterium]|nr:isoprenylcysteine carboxylmethyltransferase family protein [Endomicrobiia bacterium]MCL2506310.1 isoprenylcysteine carboxylmethyltransferase family protein [Endomicrobiia bacterium]